MQVLVLNASYEPLNVCTVKRAHVLVFKGKAEVIESLDRPLRSATSTFVWPNVIRLVEEVGLTMGVRPTPPSPSLFIRIAAPKIPQTWAPYLGEGPLGSATAA